MKVFKQTFVIVLLTVFVVAFMKCDAKVMKFLGLIPIVLLFHKSMFLIQKLSSYYIRIKFFKIEHTSINESLKLS